MFGPVRSILAVLALCTLAAAVASAQSGGPRKCIMVFGPHTDDVEGLASGTLAKYTKGEGYEGIYVVMYNNSCCGFLGRSGGFGAPPLETDSNATLAYPIDALESIQIRNEEARNAAAVYGAKTVFLNHREETIWIGRTRVYNGQEDYVRYDPPGVEIPSLASEIIDHRRVVTELLKTYRPEITIIPTLGGEKQSHANNAYLVYLAYQQAVTDGVPLGKLWMRAGRPGAFWLLDPPAQASGRGQADVRIDVTDFRSFRMEATSKHRSQTVSGRKFPLKAGERHYENFITVFDSTKTAR